MAFDGFFCMAIALELKEKLTRARVDKINCRDNAVEFSLYAEGEKKFLFFSLAASANFVTLYDKPSLSAETPAPFGLLLKKHLLSSRICDITSEKNERIIKIIFDSRDELGHLSEKTLFAEIMGKYSNLILTSSGKVLGALHTTDLISFKRAVMPGINYTLPPAQDKTSAEDIDISDFRAMTSSVPEKKADAFLLERFFCFSPLSAWETAFAASGKSDASLGETAPQNLFAEVKKLCLLAKEGEYTPTAVFDGQKPVEFYFTDINRYPGLEKKRYDSLCELTAGFFGAKSGESLSKSLSSDLIKTVSARLKRVERKILLQLTELEKAKDTERNKLYGSLILSHIYEIKKGDEVLACKDFDGEYREVKLNKNFTPSQNAEAYFKKYRKLKNSKAALVIQIEEGRREKEYLASVIDAVTRCNSKAEVDLIREELETGGYLKKKKEKRRAPPLPPLEYKTSGGFTVKAGRNNIMNDILTKTAGKSDFWFHVKGYPGSHVILYTRGKEPGLADFSEATRIAAYHSSRRGEKNVEVDYTEVKNVRKPSGSKAGFVTYEKQKTAVADAALPETE
ncbi:MAG: NFACT family protein [Eubacteriales bacterium]